MRVLIAVADNGSHAGAADALGVSQSAVTRAIRNLEAITGTPLVESRCSALTTFGRETVSRAREVITAVDGMSSGVLGTRKVRLGYTGFMPHTWERRLAGTIDPLGLAAYPVDVEFTVRAIDEGVVNVSICRGEAFERPGIRLAPVGTEPYVVAVGPDRTAAEFDWEEFEGTLMAVNTVPEGPHRVQRIHYLCRGVYDLHESESWLEMVAAGHNVGVVPEGCSFALSHDQVRFAPLRGAPEIPLTLAWRTSATRDSPDLEKFVEAALLLAEDPITSARGR